MTEQSPAAICYAFEDAQADITELAEQLDRMKRLLSRIAYPARNTPDEFADLNMFAAEVQATWSMDDLEANVKSDGDPVDESSLKSNGDAYEGLPSTTCSRSFLETRWYDKQWDKWTEWEEVEGFELRVKYGTTPEEWKAACKIWIELGGHYEYRIGTRTDVVEWKISYRENA